MQQFCYHVFRIQRYIKHYLIFSLVNGFQYLPVENASLYRQVVQFLLGPEELQPEFVTGQARLRRTDRLMIWPLYLAAENLLSRIFSFLVAHSATPYISSSVRPSHFFKFKHSYSLYWYILLYFSSLELSDPLAEIPCLICLVYAFYEVSIKFLVLL